MELVSVGAIGTGVMIIDMKKVILLLVFAIIAALAA